MRSYRLTRHYFTLFFQNMQGVFFFLQFVHLMEYSSLKGDCISGSRLSSVYSISEYKDRLLFCSWNGQESAKQLLYYLPFLLIGWHRANTHGTIHR